MITKSVLSKYNKLKPELFIDKKILKTIDKESTLLGKELLLCSQAKAIRKEKNISSHVQYYIISILWVNAQFGAFIAKQLQDDKKNLRAHITKTFNKLKADRELHQNIFQVADTHYKKAKNHLGKYKKASKKQDLHRAVYHNAVAEHLFGELSAQDVKRLLKEVAVRKLASVYEEMLNRCKIISKAGLGIVKNVEKKGSLLKADQKALDELCKAVASQEDLLRGFAANYSKSIVKTIEYARGKKIVK